MTDCDATPLASSATANPAPSQVLDESKELTALGLEVLMTAVRVARTRQTQKVATLKLQLSAIFPSLSDQEFNQVLSVWATRARHHNY